MAFSYHAIDDGERSGQHLSAMYQMPGNLVHMIEVSSRRELTVQP
jgi:hypothetical protein